MWWPHMLTCSLLKKTGKTSRCRTANAAADAASKVATAAFVVAHLPVVSYCAVSCRTR